MAGHCFSQSIKLAQTVAVSWSLFRRTSASMRTEGEIRAALDAWIKIRDKGEISSYGFAVIWVLEWVLEPIVNHTTPPLPFNEHSLQK